MKINHLQIYCFFLFLLLFSCNGSNKKSSPIPHIDIEGNINEFQKIYLSEYADSVWYVPLESRSDHPLSWTYAVLFNVSGNYLFDSNQKECVLYDKNGHFVRTIGKQGRGPGEYQGISNAYLLNDKIYMHDYYTDDLNEYNIDGAFLKRYKSGYTGDEKYRLEFREAIMINDSMIFGNIENESGQAEYKALIIDKQGHIRYSYKNYIKFSLSPGINRVKAPGGAIIYSIGDKVFFKELLNDTLFQMDNHYRLTPTYIFDFGKYKEPLSERGKKWNFSKLNSYITLLKVFDMENYLILECDFNNFSPAKRLTPEIIKIPGLEDYTQWYNSQTVLGIYDNKKQILTFSKPTSTNNHLFTSGFYNDIDGGPRFMPYKMVNDTTMVMKIRFDHLVNHIKSDDFKNSVSKYLDKKKNLEMLVDSLQKADFDNPVYMFCTLK